MSVCTSDNSHTPCVRLNTAHVSSPPEQTTYRKAINTIRIDIKNALRKHVHIYAFNIPSEQLVSAYTLLDKEEERKSMKVTYSEDYNFIVRYMPSRAYEVAISYWNYLVLFALHHLTAQPYSPYPPGCMLTGATTSNLGPMQKQPDGSIEPVPNPSHCPSVILEVGSSESLTQLQIDARLWIEHMPLVQLVILLSIDPPIGPQPNFPRITIQLWRGFPPHRASTRAPARQREARRVWEADWTQGATPFYILFSDIFRGPAPPQYGNHDRVDVNTVAWRQTIIDSYIL